MVSPTALRCRVPPGPGIDGTGHVVIRVEVSSRSSVDSRRSNASKAVGTDPYGRQQMRMFEYRCPVDTRSNSAPAAGDSSTPMVRTRFAFVRQRFW